MSDVVAQIILDAAGVVVGTCRSDILAPGAVVVSEAIFAAATGQLGQVRYAAGQISSYTPPIDLAAYAAAAHLARRDGGVTIGGMLVKSDGESRSLITGAYALSDAKPDATIDFKAASGWITLNAAQMQTVALGVGGWVQACYSAYRAVSAGLASGAITTPSQIDAAFAAVVLPS
ncbi:DUF4376 domain-containing protein [Methylobacterium sp. WL6]|uniref:DUF4376 domain-containing protein n=1 Tax=Methylobacterium sp. WL6 TaxID=2603901 RepID=UPI0011CB6873|nr:DUF4376 domain-containing protein [Methylobacterium sp. WL6]TXN67270.1 DUF4376 domain-containing protein [Methylobacterium sp. WL6]